MRTTIVFALTLALAGCVYPTVEEVEAPPPEESAAFPLTITNPRSAHPHTVEGRFTGWIVGRDPQEWSDILPAPLTLANVYADYDGERLYLMIDGTAGGLGHAPTGCPLILRASTDEGRDRWEGHWAGFTPGSFVRNGAFDPDFERASSHSRTPLYAAQTHWAHEVVLPMEPGPFSLLIEGSTGQSCTSRLSEPIPIAGELFIDGGVRLELHDRPVLAGSAPLRVAAGALVTLFGSGLADVTEIVVGRRTVAVRHAVASRLQFQMPAGFGELAEVEVLVGRDVNGVALRAAPFNIWPWTPNSASQGWYPPSLYPITVDGRFTDWEAGGDASFEWADVPPLTGRYTHLYVTYANEKLYMLNDWHINNKTVPATDCYNEFSFAVGSPPSDYTVRVHNSGDVTVLVDGVHIEDTELEVEGGHSVGTSPLNPDKPHTIWELSVAAPPGGSHCQLHDPGPNPQSSCEDLLSEPNVFEATLMPGGGFFGGLTDGPVVLSSPDALTPRDEVVLRVPNLGHGGVVVIGGSSAPLEPGEGQDRWTFTVPDLPPGITSLHTVSAAGRPSRPRPVTVLVRAPGAVWTEVPTNAPARTGHAAVMEGGAQRVLMFGGTGANGLRSDTVVYENAAISTLVGALFTRTNAGMANLTSGSPILFGGMTAGGPRNDTVRWTGSAWQIYPAGIEPPSARAEFGIVTSPSGALLYGGIGNAGTPLADAWVFDGGMWELVADSGSGPGGRQAPAMAWVPQLGAALVFGGRDALGQPSDALWSLSLAGSWQQLDAGVGPSARSGATMAVLDGVPVLFGGLDAGGQALGDGWALDGDLRWVSLEAVGVQPSPRWGAPLVLDPASAQLFLHGGQDASGPLRDAWLLTVE